MLRCSKRAITLARAYSKEDRIMANQAAFTGRADTPSGLGIRSILERIILFFDRVEAAIQVAHACEVRRGPDRSDLRTLGIIA